MVNIKELLKGKSTIEITESDSKLIRKYDLYRNTITYIPPIGREITNKLTRKAIETDVHYYLIDNHVTVWKHTRYEENGSTLKIFLSK